ALSLVLVLLKLTHPLTLLVYLSLPVAIRNAKEFSQFRIDNFQPIVMLDVKTAQLHMQFGLLFAISTLMSKVL
ncbi:MAG: hypothetical protein ACK4SO_05500, partial [Candidatus Kapaibacteriota bacterium]